MQKILPEMRQDTKLTAQSNMSELVAVPRSADEPGAARAMTDGGRFCEQLERGQVIYFPESPIDFPQAERSFLLTLQQTGARYHKNIAYRPEDSRVTGFAGGGPGAEDRLRNILGAYSDRVTRFLTGLLSPYAHGMRRELASFRPLEERGRQIRLHARNDLLHVDAFPTRPTNGDRILRFFTNINPTEPRVWLTTETFEGLAGRLARPAGLDTCAAAQSAGAARLKRWGRALGLPIRIRSPYDQFMLRFHHFLKEYEEFQRDCPKNRIEFPPGSSWIVYTDMACHAVLSGQFALEQTFIVSRRVLVSPEHSPASVLEKLCGRPLTYN